VNLLQTVIVILNLTSLYGVPNAFLDELLLFLAGDLLPQANCMVRNTSKAKRLMMKMGLQHERIHCCPSGHILYEGPFADLEECPTCAHPRYVLNSNKVPVTVMRYFPLIPRLQRLFRCPEVARLLK
jgi:hypothetical protein